MSPRAAAASPRASIPPSIHTGQNIKKDVDTDCEPQAERGTILDRRPREVYNRAPQISISKLESKPDDDVEVCLCDSDDGSPTHRVYQRRPVISMDDDSIVDRIMMSFDAPQSSGEDDDEFLGHMYGVKLRNKESIEAELELRYGGYSRSGDEEEDHVSSDRLRSDQEHRDPPPTSPSCALQTNNAVTTRRNVPSCFGEEDDDHIHTFAR
jgi:hypothetical protein